MAHSFRSKNNIAVRIFETPSVPQGRMKIVLLKVGERIGDFVIAMEAFRIIRQAFASAEITLVCQPSIVSFAKTTGLFDRVTGFAYVLDVMQEGKLPQADREDQEAAFAALLNGPYFLAADFRHDGSTRGWLDHIDAVCRAGFFSMTSKRLDISLPEMEWDVPVASLANGHLPIHSEQRLVLLARAIVDTLIQKSAEVDWFPLPEGCSNLPSYQRLASDTRLKVGVSLGAGSELRQWQPGYWATLLKRMAMRNNILIVFMGGPDDCKITADIAAQLPKEHCVDLTGAIALEFVPAYMKMFDYYIGCDTGLTHLAAKLEVSTINLFAGISNISAWRACGPRVKTIYAEVPCAPCHLRLREDCPNNQICMNVILPDMVYACFEQLVAERKERELPDSTQLNAG